MNGSNVKQGVTYITTTDNTKRISSTKQGAENWRYHANGNTLPKGQFFRCILRDNYYSSNNVYETLNHPSCDFTFQLSSHANMKEANLASPSTRKYDAESVKVQIKKADKQIKDLQEALDAKKAGLEKLNAKYRLLTNFETDEDAIAHVINSMKNATPEQVIAKIRASGLSVSV